MNYKNFSTICFLILTLLSCSDDNDGESFGMTISPADNYFERAPGGEINFSISVQSREPLTRFRIQQSINESNSTTLVDKSISGKAYSDFFDYTVSDTFSFGTHTIRLMFSSLDARGNEMKRAKFITVKVTDRPLDEYGSYTMYSSLSNQFDAFNLLTGTPIYSSDTLAHIRDLSFDASTNDLSRAWTSPRSDIKFLKFNDFDYGNATVQSLKTAYDAGIKNDTIRNLAPNDIVLSKIDNKYLAIKLIFVTDENGNVNDRYIFTVKR